MINTSEHDENKGAFSMCVTKYPQPALARLNKPNWSPLMTPQWNAIGAPRFGVGAFARLLPKFASEGQVIPLRREAPRGEGSHNVRNVLTRQLLLIERGELWRLEPSYDDPAHPCR